MPVDSLTGDVREKVDAWLESLLEPNLRDNLDVLCPSRNDYGYDPFGFNPDYLKYLLPFATLLYRKYFRAEVFDIERVPEQGRVLLIANHSGQIPFDGLMIGVSMLVDRTPPRMLRSMVERWLPTLPFLSYLFPRWGQIVGTPENCRMLLEQEGAILVFPEGVRGSNKTFDKRYQLQEFGSGFMRLALEHRVPIVPVAVIGGEEQIVSLWNAEKVGRLVGMPALPIGPGLLFGPLGMVTPLPTKYRIYYGEPMYFHGESDDDDRAISEKVDEVKRVLDLMIHDGLQQRNGIFT